MATAQVLSTSKKTVAFVDGSNLFGGVAEILKPGEYFEFSEFLAALEKEIHIDAINFYGTYMRFRKDDTPERRLLIRAQKAFFDGVRSLKKVNFYQGHFSPTSGKEKGVDIHLGIDMAVGASTAEYTEAVIITEDADLVYAVETARRFKKFVTVAALSSRFSLALAFKSNRKIVIDIGNLFEKSIRPKALAKLHNLTLIDFKPTILRVKPEKYNRSAYDSSGNNNARHNNAGRVEKLYQTTFFCQALNWGKQYDRSI